MLPNILYILWNININNSLSIYLENVIFHQKSDASFIESFEPRRRSSKNTNAG